MIWIQAQTNPPNSGPLKRDTVQVRESRIVSGSQRPEDPLCPHEPVHIWQKHPCAHPIEAIGKSGACQFGNVEEKTPLRRVHRRRFQEQCHRFRAHRLAQAASIRRGWLQRGDANQSKHFATNYVSRRKLCDEPFFFRYCCVHWPKA